MLYEFCLSQFFFKKQSTKLHHNNTNHFLTTTVSQALCMDYQETFKQPCKIKIALLPILQKEN